MDVVAEILASLIYFIYKQGYVLMVAFGTGYIGTWSVTLTPFPLSLILLAIQYVIPQSIPMRPHIFGTRFFYFSKFFSLPSLYF